MSCESAKHEGTVIDDQKHYLDGDWKAVKDADRLPSVLEYRIEFFGPFQCIFGEERTETIDLSVCFSTTQASRMGFTLPADAR